MRICGRCGREESAGHVLVEVLALLPRCRRCLDEVRRRDVLNQGVPFRDLADDAEAAQGLAEDRVDAVNAIVKTRHENGPGINGRVERRHRQPTVAHQRGGLGLPTGIIKIGDEPGNPRFGVLGGNVFASGEARALPVPSLDGFTDVNPEPKRWVMPAGTVPYPGAVTVADGRGGFVPPDHVVAKTSPCRGCGVTIDNELAEGSGVCLACARHFKGASEKFLGPGALVYKSNIVMADAPPIDEGLFGDGSDGSPILDDKAIPSWAELTSWIPRVLRAQRDVFLRDLRLTPGVKLSPGRFRIYVSGDVPGGSLGSHEGAACFVGVEAPCCAKCSRPHVAWQTCNFAGLGAEGLEDRCSDRIVALLSAERCVLKIGHKTWHFGANEGMWARETGPKNVPHDAQGNEILHAQIGEAEAWRKHLVSRANVWQSIGAREHADPVPKSWPNVGHVPMAHRSWIEGESAASEAARKRKVLEETLPPDLLRAPTEAEMEARLAAGEERPTRANRCWIRRNVADGNSSCDRTMDHAGYHFSHAAGAWSSSVEDRVADLERQFKQMGHPLPEADVARVREALAAQQGTNHEMRRERLAEEERLREIFHEQPGPHPFQNAMVAAIQKDPELARLLGPFGAPVLKTRPPGGDERLVALVEEMHRGFMREITRSVLGVSPAEPRGTIPYPGAKVVADGKGGWVCQEDLKPEGSISLGSPWKTCPVCGAALDGTPHAHSAKP